VAAVVALVQLVVLVTIHKVERVVMELRPQFLELL
jgi:hypothetical protein